MKKTISLIAAGLVAIAGLTACGNETPTQPTETVTMQSSPTEDLGPMPDPGMEMNFTQANPVELLKRVPNCKLGEDLTDIGPSGDWEGADAEFGTEGFNGAMTAKCTVKTSKGQYVVHVDATRGDPWVDIFQLVNFPKRTDTSFPFVGENFYGSIGVTYMGETLKNQGADQAELDKVLKSLRAEEIKEDSTGETAGQNL